MSIWIAAAAVVAAGVAVAGGAMAISSAHAADVAADAQKQVAETNARATVEAAKQAADAQKEAALDDMKAREYDSKEAYNQEIAYEKHEDHLISMENSNENFYKQTQSEVDSIDMYYGDSGPMGSNTQEMSYDYGGGGGGGHA